MRKTLTPVQEMALMDLCMWGQLVRDGNSGRQDFGGLANEYNAGVISQLVARGYARVTHEKETGYRPRGYILRVVPNPFPDRLGLNYGLISPICLLEGDIPWGNKYPYNRL